MLRRDLDPDGDLSNDNPCHKILDLDTNNPNMGRFSSFPNERERESIIKIKIWNGEKNQYEN